jgi:hypothetical protein
MKTCPFMRVVEDQKGATGYRAKCIIPEKLQEICIWLRKDWLSTNGEGDVCTYSLECIKKGE